MMITLSTRLSLVLSVNISYGGREHALQNIQKASSRLHLIVLLKQKKLLSIEAAAYGNGLRSSGEAENMCCKTIGMGASFCFPVSGAFVYAPKQ